MDRLLRTVHQAFDLHALEEFTVEAGRPDTITREKLTVLKKYGVDRISINPQSMNDAVLEGSDAITAHRMCWIGIKQRGKLGSPPSIWTPLRAWTGTRRKALPAR